MKKSDIKMYQTLTKFLGDALGQNFEIVFHVIDGDDSYIAAIENGNVSGRSIDAPLTDLALNLIETKVYETEDYVANYKGKTPSNNEIQGSTYFIKDENGALEGMLCINVDLELPKQITHSLFRMLNVTMDGFSVYHNGNDEMEEFFPESVRDIVFTIVDPSLLDSRTQIKPDQLSSIIIELDKRGVFKIKGAVSEVAAILNVSEPSVYRYLKRVRNKS